jgi:hypothetical protein
VAVVGEDARACLADGLLLCGATAMRQLSARIDRDTACTIFEASGPG